MSLQKVEIWTFR